MVWTSAISMSVQKRQQDQSGEMEKNCGTCKWSLPIEPRLVWSEDMEKSLQEEIERNKRIKEENEKHSSWLTHYRNTSYTYQMVKANYEDELKYVKDHIECRCMPMFVNRRLDDVCGQWSK